MTSAIVNYCKRADSFWGRWLPSFLLPSKSIPFTEFSKSPEGTVDEETQEKIYQIFQGISAGDIAHKCSWEMKGFKHEEWNEFTRKFETYRDRNENVTLAHPELPNKIFKDTIITGEFTKYPGFDCSVGPFRMNYHGMREGISSRVDMAERARIAKEKNGLYLIEIPKKQMAKISKDPKDWYRQVAVIDKLKLDKNGLAHLNRLSISKAFQIFYQVFSLIKETGLIDVSFRDGNISFLEGKDRVAFIDTERWRVNCLQNGGVPEYYVHDFNMDLSEIRSSNENIVLVGGPRSAEISLALAVIARLSSETEPFLNLRTTLAMNAAYYAVLAKGNLEIAANFCKAWNYRALIPVAVLYGLRTFLK